MFLQHAAAKCFGAHVAQPVGCGVPQCLQFLDSMLANGVEDARKGREDESFV